MTARRFLLLFILLGAAVTIWAYLEAVQPPLVRRASVTMRDWPNGAPPLSLVLISDVHVGGPDMPPSRLSGIVEQINALKPDLVLMAGDFVSDKGGGTRTYSLAQATAPLAALRPRLGTFAVLGNHDHWRDAADAGRALAAASVRLLTNDAVEVGPLALGGLDDAFTEHADLDRAVERMRSLKGARLLLSHSPDPFAELPGDVTLMLAGHTHCGQIRLPLIGTLSTMSRFGERYACGRIVEGGKILFVTAGLGTSILPLRLGARPDLWLLELRGPQATSR